jgi:copper transporter 1
MPTGFISSTWHITSKGMFAGSCIGVILLVMSLELLRRASAEYDQYIVRQAEKSYQEIAVTNIVPSPSVTGFDDNNKSTSQAVVNSVPVKFRPGVLRQMVRATLHMVQFAIAYFVMLLAMYYNGYIIISIIIGAWLGAFVFSWQSVTLG